MQPDVISVVAGGWSFRGVDQRRVPGLVIGVNDAGTRLPICHTIVSMDRLWTEHRWEELKRLRRYTLLREACLPNIKERPWWLDVYKCDHTTSEIGGYRQFNGTNSGAVAAQFALAFNPKVLYLFGFDMGVCPRTKRKYWYDDYSWVKPGAGVGNLHAWAKQFEPLAAEAKRRGIKVLNCSLASTIPVFKKVDPQRVLE